MSESREADAVSDLADPNDRNSELVKSETLLLKELDETHTWARLGAQLYFGAFTILLTVNGFGMGWLFTHKGTAPPFTFLAFFVFIGLNLFGAIMTYLIHRQMLRSDERIARVIDTLTPHLVAEESSSKPRSPMPRGAIKIAFFFAGASALMLFVFWTVLAVWGFTAGLSSLVVGRP